MKKKITLKYKPLLVFALLLCTIFGFAQSSSRGNTFIFGNGKVTVHAGNHSFLNGGSGTLPGIIGTERTAPNGYLQFMEGTTWSGASNSAHVDGYVKTYKSSLTIFPIGDNGLYRPAAVSTASLVQPADAAYYNSNPNIAVTTSLKGGNEPALPAGAPFLVSSKGAGVGTVSPIEYWDINGNTSANITLTWDSSSSIGTLTGSNLSNLTIVGWDGVAWQLIPSTFDATSILGGSSSLTSGSITTNLAMQPSSYTVYALASGCSAINPGVLSGNQNICIGSTTTFATNGDTGGIWSSSNLLVVNVNSSTGLISGIAPGTATITYTVNGTSGCSISSVRDITVTPAPTDVVASPENFIICTNKPQVYPLSVTGGVSSGNATIGTGIISPGATTYPNPFSAYNGGAKHQMIYTASELSAAGVIPSNITEISFQFSNFTASSCNNLTIRMKHTTQSTLSGFETGTTQVYTTPSFVPSATGWVTFTLNTPFAWNGTNNLLVEIVHNAGNFGNGSGTRTFCTNTTSNMTFVGASDNISGGIAGFDALTSWNVSGAFSSRPNARFGYHFEKVVWSPNTNLYTDLACTIPYDGVSHASNLYANPTSSITYTATATRGTCSKSDSVSIAPQTAIYNPTLYASNTPANWSSAPNVNSSIVIEGNLATNSDIEACRCTINSGDVIFNSGSTLSLVNELTVNGGSITFEDDSSLVQANDAAINTGNILYKRTTLDNTPSSIDYVYWASPTTNAVTATNSYYWNTTVTNSSGSQGNWLSANAVSMQPGVGYIMRDVFSKNFIGVPFNGVIQPMVTRGNDITSFNDNWNLLGNPYPSAIDVNKFLNDNTNIEGSVSLWTHGSPISSTNSNPFYNNYTYNFSSNDYIIYNGTGTTSGPSGFNGYVASGQAFFVKLLETGPSSQSVTFNNSMRSITYDNSQFYRNNNFSNPEIEKNRIWLDIVNSNQLSARTLIGYIEGATNDVDRIFDATTSTNQDQKIYSLIDNSKYIIQGRALPFNVLDTVPLGVDIPASGNYTISIHALEGVFNTTQDVFLEDLSLNLIHNLKINPYSFSSNAGSFVNRFILRFTDSTLSNDDIVNSNDDSVYIVNNNNLQIHSLSQEIKNVKVFDVLGKQILNTTIENSSKIVELPIVKSNNMLIIYITLNNGVVVSKKTIF